MKIAIFMDRFEAGGVTTHNLILGSELLKRGHEILLYTAVAYNENIQFLEQISDSFYYRYWGEDPVEDVAFFKPDLIHAHPFSSIDKGFQVAKNLNIPLIITSHGLYPIGIDRLEGGKKRCEKIHRIIAVDFSVIFFLKDEISCPEKMTVIPNGIDLELFHPYSFKPEYKIDLGLNPDWFTLVFLGRLGDGKQLPLLQLFQCLDPILRHLAGINLVIVGGGPYHTEFEQKSEKLMTNMKNLNIKAVGHQFDVQNFIAAADLVLACDRAALEAMACHRPVLGAYGSGFKEILNLKHYHYFLNRYKNFPSLTNEQLIQTILEIAKKETNLEEIIQGGFQIVTDYHDIKNIAIDHELIYQQSLIY